MENKYITTRNGFKVIVETAVLNNFIVQVYESYDKKKQNLLEAENYEELIELEKLKHFDFRECLNFELYAKVLKAKV